MRAAKIATLLRTINFFTLTSPFTARTIRAGCHEKRQRVTTHLRLDSRQFYGSPPTTGLHFLENRPESRLLGPWRAEAGWSVLLAVLEKNDGEAPVLLQNNRTITSAELAVQARALAGALAARNIVEGDRVALL